MSSGPADCMVATTSEASNTYTVSPEARPTQLCACTTCEGDTCASHFWAPTVAGATCPYRPLLYFQPNITTFFDFPGATGQQPNVDGMQGGNWCRFRSNTKWVTGYVRDGACNSGDGRTSTYFELFCPFAVSSCKQSCGHRGLVDRATLKSCACDYWCQLYGDCCGSDTSNPGEQCSTMQPTTELAYAASCPNRLGINAQESACHSYRPAGMYICRVYELKGAGV